eukprot:CAMPEP_0178457500 /NCGR_PEP_ID=MMETSP0689_2-20121128/47047_1 /TAXON_ID=160604 /ORGANISM="Amphidinium massartii, Strain CS-259" /LENGTH=50 /DNA_ID=CAMNT_0020083749 /DNA_START=89 /DNA_END=241 /DNA_ORIENTATION=+
MRCQAPAAHLVPRRWEAELDRGQRPIDHNRAVEQAQASGKEAGHESACTH